MPGQTHDSAGESHSASPPRVTRLPTYHRPLLPSLLQTTQLNKSRELLYGRYKVTLLNSWHLNPKTHHRAKDQGAEPALLCLTKGHDVTLTFQEERALGQEGETNPRVCVCHRKRFLRQKVFLSLTHSFLIVKVMGETDFRYSVGKSHVFDPHENQ